MKRDMDIIRNILLTVEESGEFHSRDDIEGYHIAIMKDAGLVVAAAHYTGDGYVGGITRLTWHGHEFLDNARSPEIWNKLKEQLQEKMASVSFDVLMELLKALIKSSFAIG